MSIPIGEIVVAFLALALLGTAFAVLLSLSYRVLAVKGDPKLELFMSILPGSNCGACGHAGCLGYAETLVKEGAEPTGCLAGGPIVAARLAEAMGVSVKAQEELVAFVACRAGRKIAKMKYDYVGVDNCQAASLLFGGDKCCDYGCIGLGSCVRVCPFDAITVTEEGLAVVNSTKCRACRKCIKACPRKLISMAPKNQTVLVACRAGRKIARVKYAYVGVDHCQAASLLFGGDKCCDYGCIGLGSCVRVCPFDAVRVTEQGLAVVDSAKCRACQKCVKACPRKLISMVPKSQTVLVACKNLDKGRKAKEVCAMACIACRICEKNCPAEAISVVNNLAVIDYAKCTRCGICVAKCPQKSIILIAARETVEALVA